MEDRDSLHNILGDDKESNKSISTKKVIFIGIIIFALFIIAIFTMKYLNPPIIAEKAMNESMKMEPKNDDNNLFKNLEVKESPQVSDNFKKVINSLKNTEKTNINTKQTAPKEEEIIAPKILSPQSIAKKRKINAFIQKGYYVQVGAFYKLTPSDELLNKVKKHGYSYHLFKSKINNSSYTKVVIGPYESKKEAISKLSDIKKIEQDAYILTLP